MSGGHIRMEIGRLVLRGIDPLDQRALVDGLKAELSRVLAEQGMQEAIRQSRNEAVIRLGRVGMQPGIAGARQLGSGVARAIGKGLKA